MLDGLLFIVCSYFSLADYAASSAAFYLFSFSLILSIYSALTCSNS